LGLCIARGIVKGHGGTLGSGRDGTWVKFTATLPQVVEDNT
jgi:signal transduction histidine kinase